MVGSLGASYYATDRLLTSLAGSYRYDDYVGKIPIDGELLKKHRRHYGVRAPARLTGRAQSSRSLLGRNVRERARQPGG